MPSTKTATLTFRIDPALKEALRIANMVEVLIRDHCGRNGIAITKPGALLPNEKPGGTRGR